MKLSLKFLVVALSALTFTAQAQLEVNDTFTATQLVNDFLLGQGVTASNITFNGQPGDEVYIQAGLFLGGSDLVLFDSALVMATAPVQSAVDQFGGGIIPNPVTNDQDLLDLSGQPNVNDCAILEFDFIANSDSLKFNYVFASTEYNQYTCSQFNDAFGFFLSGPGITGPYSGGAINIALVPDSDVPVAINTINGGAPTGSGTAANCEAANPNWIEDSQYFVNNSTQPATDVQYNGMTVTLTALADIECGVEYHIKLAIADAVDGALDSGVFIEAGSFSAFGEVFVNVEPTVGGAAVTNPQYADVLVAGCSEFDIELIRPNGADIDSILVDFGGTAVEGEDYILGQNDTLFFFPDGIDTLNFAIQTLWDGVPDENEVLTVIVYFQDGCGDYDSTFASLPFVDPYMLTSSTNNVELFCPTEVVSISAQGGNGIDPYEYNWGNFGTSQEVAVDVPDDQQYYYVGITDACGFEVKMDSVLVTNSIPPPLETMILPFAQPDCPGEPVSMESNTTNGNPPYSYNWSTNDGTFSTSEVATISEIFDTDVFLMIVDSCGTQVNDSTMIIYPQYDPLTVMFPPLGDNCPTEPVALDAIVTGGAGDTEFAWSQIEGSGEFVISNTEQNTAIIPSSGMNIYQVEATDHCFRSGYFGINPGSAVFVDSLRVIDLSNIANVITPNNDNKNDFFVIEGVQEFDDARLEIYDRWGRLVFNTDNYMAGFADGKFENAFSGNNLEDGTYYYVIDVDKGECTQSGNIEILRSND
jgi:gliding motility-associated-like protein